MFSVIQILQPAQAARSTTRDEIYSLLPTEKIRRVIDAGAYNGDTAREMKGYFPNLEEVYAIEPDRKNFKKLVKYSEAETQIKVIPINSAVWSEDAGGSFFTSGNRNATVVATASYQHTEEEISLRRIDSLDIGEVDYIKYDVEGAEAEALIGSRDTISKYTPPLLISLYHRSRDIFYLINKVREEWPEYSLYLRRLRCLPAWEIDLIAVKNT